MDFETLQPEDCEPVPGKPTQWVAPDGTILCGKVGQSLGDLLAELRQDEALERERSGGVAMGSRSAEVKAKKNG